MSRWSMSRSSAVSCALVVLAAAVPPTAVAAPGDRAGWSTTTDPRGRAFLSWVEKAGGPVLLRLGCLTDVDLFDVAAHLPGLAPGPAAARLELTAGAARHRFDGTVTDEPADGGVAFRSEFDAETADRRAMAKTLAPVLAGREPVVVSVGTVKATLAVDGLAEAAKRFAAVCFGRR